MVDSSYNVWISLYDDDCDRIFQQEKAGLKRLSMIYSAFQKEIAKVQDCLSSEYNEIKTKFEQNNSTKSTKLEITTPIKEIPETELFTLKSPTITTNRLCNLRNKKSSPTNQNVPKQQTKSKLLCKKDDNKETTRICDTTNLIDCSIVETTPIATKKRSFIKNSRLKTKKRKPSQNTTLTQMFCSPPKKEKNNQLDSNLVSMGIEEILDFISDNNEKSDENKENHLVEDSCDSDETIELINDDDDGDNNEILNKNNESLLKFVDNYDKLPDRKVLIIDKKKLLKGWSCKQCENFYKGLNLPADELAKKMDKCSRHRRQLEHDETMPGFWDMSFKPSPKTQEKDEESMVFHYKR